MSIQAMDIDRPLAQEIVKRLNHMFGEANYHIDQVLLSILDDRGYVLLDKIVLSDSRLRELTGGRAAYVKAALQIVPSTVLQVSRDKKYIRRVTTEVRIVRFLDTIFKDLLHPNNSDLANVASQNDGHIWINTIFEMRPEFAQMAWGNGLHVVSACVRGRPRYTELCEDNLRVRRKDLRERVASQIEYYFSEENLPYDKHLRVLIDTTGSVPVHDLMNFPALKQLSQDPMLVLEALRNSTCVEATLRLPEANASAQQGGKAPAVDLAASVTVRLIPRQRQIINALEHLFSESYISQERFLQRVLEDSPQGYVNLTVLMSFNRIAALQCTVEELVIAANSSEMMEVSPNSLSARSKTYRRVGRANRPARLDLPKSQGTFSEAFPLPSPNTHNQIVTLLEYYFGDENFPVDRYLQSLAVDEPATATTNEGGAAQGLHRKGPSTARLVYGGWVPLVELIKFQRLQLLRVTLSDVRSAVGAYDRSLQLSNDGMYIRRKHPLPPGAPIIGRDGIQPEMYFKEMPGSNRSFVVMQYNVLADHLCREEWFPYTSDEVRNWTYRRKLLQKQIRYRCPDLLCLEEIQSVMGMDCVLKMKSDPGEEYGENHVAWFTEWLRSDGYELHYVRREIKPRELKESEAPPMVEIGNLLAWKTSEFEFIESQDVVLSNQIQNLIDLYQQRNEALMTPCHLDKIVRRSTHFLANCSTQVASFVRLRHKATNQQIAFCGIHVTANFRAPYLQIVQVQVCLEEIEKFTSASRIVPANQRRMPQEDIPVVLCGDFNSTPEQGVVTLLASGELAASHIDLERGYEMGLVSLPRPCHHLGLLSTHHWAARHAGGMINGLPICEQVFKQAQEKQQHAMMAHQQQQHQQHLIAMQNAGIIPGPGSVSGIVPPHFSHQQAQLALKSLSAMVTTTQRLQQMSASGQAQGNSDGAHTRSDGAVPATGASAAAAASSAAEATGASGAAPFYSQPIVGAPPPIVMPNSVQQQAFHSSAAEATVAPGPALFHPLSAVGAPPNAMPSSRQQPTFPVTAAASVPDARGLAVATSPSQHPALVQSESNPRMAVQKNGTTEGSSLPQQQQQDRHLTLDLQGQSRRPAQSLGADSSQGAAAAAGNRAAAAVGGGGAPLAPDRFRHQRGLAYAASPCSPGIPQLPITNYTHLFSGCLDYIWLTPRRGLQIESALGGVPLSLLAEDTGLPSPRFPSDHLPVLARLSFQ